MPDRRSASGSRTGLHSGARIDLLGATPQYERHLLDDDTAYQIGQVSLTHDPGGHWAPIDDDPGRQPRTRLGSETTPQHHGALPWGRVRGRHLLNGELDPVHGRPASGQVLGRVHDELVEALGPGTPGRQVRRKKRTAQPPAVTVTTPGRPLHRLRDRFRWRRSGREGEQVGHVCHHKRLLDDRGAAAR